MFRKLVKITLSAALSLMSLQAYALDLPTKEINGKNYYYYEVQPRETIYSLCKRLGVTKDEIVKYNPTVADGLRAHQTLYFPVAAYDKDEATTTITEQRIINHEVSRGETIYGICKTYNVESKQLFELNPDAANGIKEGMILKIPVTKTTKTTQTTFDGISENGLVYHTIEKGESLYAISNKYNTSVENLLELNPGLSPDNYQAGTVIRIRPEEKKAEEIADATEVESSKYKQYKVQKNENLYSIARKNNISLDELEKANPGVEQVKKGQIINLPDSKSISSDTQSEQTATPIESIYEDVHGKSESKEIRIAVMLPFMLTQESPSKQAMLYTDFYKGFLLAVDSLRNIGTPIHISTFDTADNLSTVKAILAKPELKEMNVIIAPDNEQHLAAIASFGKANNCNIFNVFAVKDTLYRENDHILQANIPHSMMYSKAIEGIVSKLSGATPVFLADTNGKNDKEEFISTFKHLLDSKGIAYQEISYSKHLRGADLENLSKSGKYIFIPTSGSQNAFLNMASAVREFKESMNNPYDVRLFGYPEWTTFRGETLERMHSLNTTIYTRFYNEAESYRTKELEEKFKQWYGAPMMSAIPMQGTLGFDSGMYIINALKKNHGDFNNHHYIYHGIQSGYDFHRPTAWSGQVNEMLYFIHFRPGGIIEKDEIK